MSGQTGGAAGGSSKKPKGPVSAYAFFVRNCWLSGSRRDPRSCLLQINPKSVQRCGKSRNVPVKGVKVKRMKKVKDPNAPKRALSAFFWFGHDERANVKGANPEFGIGDVTKELGKMWGGMNDAAKSKKWRSTKTAESRAGAAAQMEEDDDDDEFEGEEEQEYEYDNRDDDFVY
ncbi:High mobility group protein DSP1, partial [Orchesella cincta]